MTGSVDGYVRTYDLRKGELKQDYLRRKLFVYFTLSRSLIPRLARPSDFCHSNKGWTNFSSGHSRLSHSLNGPIKWEDVERFSITHYDFVSL